MTNPKLVRRIKRWNSRMLECTYKYFPREVSRIDDIPIGAYVTVMSEPVGKLNMLQVEYNDKNYNIFLQDLSN